MIEIKGFKVLQVRLPGCKNIHHIYFKKHEGKGSDDKSLFMCNLPVFTDLKIIKKFIQDIAIGATVQSFIPSYLTDSLADIYIDLGVLTSDMELTPDINDIYTKIPKNCGIVSFIDKSAFQLASSNLKQFVQNQKVYNWSEPENSGSNYYLNLYKSQILNTETLSNQVSQSLIEFDELQKASRDNLQRQSELVDEDGFTLVVGNQNKTKTGIMGQQKLGGGEVLDSKSKKNNKEKQDFYRFQLRQRKKDEMNDLLKKFKADQEKVRLMKEKKKFKPY